jgi:prefoldin subunit 5
MSTPTRAELAGNVSQLKAVSEQIIMEMRMLDERISGLYAFIQQLPNYDETVEQLKEKAKQNKNDKKLEI